MSILSAIIASCSGLSVMAFAIALIWSAVRFILEMPSFTSAVILAMMDCAVPSSAANNVAMALPRVDSDMRPAEYILLLSASSILVVREDLAT